MDKSKLPSRHTTVGPERAPHRSYYYAMGLDEAQIAQPIVGVVSSWNEAAPCNISLRRQADAAKRGVTAAGGTPREFTTITVTDGIAMGHAGMKSSLVSRETIADSVELTVRGHTYDALVAIGGCDKALPGLMMAMVRLDVPSVFLYGGSIMPGRYQGRDVTVLDVFEGVGKHSAGKMTLAELTALEKVACPGAGSCGGQYTANSMAYVSEAIGLALPGSASPPAVLESRDIYAERAGEAVMRLLRDGPRPRQIVTRKSLENAAAVVAATGGSTNATLHLPALAHEAGIAFDLFDVAEVFARTPLLADLKPGGKYLAKDVHEIGGVSIILKALLDGGYLHGDCITVTGRTLAENLADVVLPEGQDVVAFQCRNPIHRAHYELFTRALDASNVSDQGVVLVHPTCGPTQDDDISGEVRFQTYERLAAEVNNPRIRWAYLPYSMHMAGPREALQHMIIRKNYGCTHFIIGRDMAGCKSSLTGDDFYGPYQAQDFARDNAPELGMETVPSLNLVFTAEEGYVTAEHAEARGLHVKKLSGTQFRQMLRGGEEIPEWFAFRSVVEVLRAAA